MFTWRLRGKPVLVSRHAFDGMNAEVPPVSIEHLKEALENPDRVEGDKYLKWIGQRTLIAYLTEYPDYFEVRSVSATRRKIV